MDVFRLPCSICWLAINFYVAEYNLELLILWILLGLLECATILYCTDTIFLTLLSHRLCLCYLWTKLEMFIYLQDLVLLYWTLLNNSRLSSLVNQNFPIISTVSFIVNLHSLRLWGLEGRYFCQAIPDTIRNFNTRKISSVDSSKSFEDFLHFCQCATTVNPFSRTVDHERTRLSSICFKGQHPSFRTQYC